MDIYISHGSRIGISHICLFVLLILYHLKVSSCLQVCHVCSHVRNFTSCQQNVRVCPHGEVCDTLSNLDGDNKQSTHAPVIIGNIIGRRKRMLSTCFRCCENTGDMSLPCNVNRCSTQVTTKSSTVSVPKTSTISSTITTTFHRTTPTSSSRTLPSSTTTSSSSSTTPMSSTTTPNSPSTTSSPSSTTPTSSTTTTTSDTTTLTSSTTTPTSSTTTPTLLTTTPTSPMTTPTSTMSTPTSCYLCNGVPPFLCERLATPLKCDTADQQFCINKLVNNRDGSRTLDRRCATEQECRQEWWERTSDRQQCTGYDPNSFTTTYFECSFCCTTPQCNKNIVPDDLYVPPRI